MPSPHDTLFRFVFQHPAHAVSWLVTALPVRIAAVIDWTTLETAADRLPGLRLQPHLADLVFLAQRRDGGAPVLLLIEHKGHHDPGLRAQLLRYAVLLRHVYQQRRGVVPMVLAVVLQHGEPRRRHHGTPRDALAPWQPMLRFVVDDLTHPDEAVLERRELTALAKLTLLCLMRLRHLPPDEVPAAFERWRHLVRAVDCQEGPPLVPPSGAAAIETVCWYALDATEVAPTALAESLSRILHRPVETIMSTLERTYQKGRAEGRTEGKAEGRAEAILRQLRRRFGDVAADIEARVRSAPLADLDRWTDRVLDAATLADVFAD